MQNIRNISIVAHINHGKSTLVTRLAEICKNIKIHTLKEQMLDSMELEEEKGITIKAQCLTLNYKLKNENFTLNIIDTPGHIDFSFEVNRSLVACQGIVLLIDVTKGIQAQTISNYKKAIENKLDIIIAINKVDLLPDKIEQLKEEIKLIFNIDKNEIKEISAKTGLGVEDLIKTLIKKIKAPENKENEELEAIIIDAWFNQYSGVNCLIYIKKGIIEINEKIITLSNKKNFKVSELGIFNPERINKDKLKAGEIGFLIFGCKNLNEIKIGDIITNAKNQTKKIIEQIKKNKPTIYASFYPTNPDNFQELKKSIEKLSLNDSSFIYSIQKSNIFGFGFKCGFLGILHMEIIQERLEREYKLELIITPPSVTFQIVYKNGKIEYINNPSEIKEITNVKEIKEPMTLLTIMTKTEYIGKIMNLCSDFRGTIKNINNTQTETILEYEIPLNEIIFNFFNKLQSITSGFLSFDYIILDFKKSDLVTLKILINDKKIDALEFIIHKDIVYKKAKNIIEKISNNIEKQLFEVKIQAAIGKKIIAKNVIKPIKKNVLSKCYGGDISRKKKLLEKQKEGKKRLKKIGNIEISQKVFTSIMNIEKK